VIGFFLCFLVLPHKNYPTYFNTRYERTMYSRSSCFSMDMTKGYIDGMGKIERLNLINSITGIKPANLVGTKSDKGIDNLAIFTSAVHIGSNPPLIGLVFRPIEEVPRHTYANIQATGYYTLNGLPLAKAHEGHYTSAKFDADESEFSACGFTPRYHTDFPAPFVKESPIQIGLKLTEEVVIKSNNTRLLIGEVIHLHIEDRLLTNEGYLDLDKGQLAGISGLNSYYGLEKKADYPYARKEDWLKGIS